MRFSLVTDGYHAAYVISRRFQAGTGDYSLRVLETSDTCLTIPHMVNECRLPLFSPGIDVPESCQSNKKQLFPGPPDYTLLSLDILLAFNVHRQLLGFSSYLWMSFLTQNQIHAPLRRGSWKVAFGSTMLGLMAPRGCTFTGNNRTPTPGKLVL